jgi:DNA-binding response OmpR family regulator
MMSDETESTTNEEKSIQTLLLVEDDEDIGEFIVQVLNDETPYSALHVNDAIQALETVGSIKPNLFILDYHLPGIDGLELSDRLHSIEGLETTPTLMLSAHPPSLKELRQRQIVLLKKPFDLSDLLKAVEKLMPRREG